MALLRGHCVPWGLAALSTMLGLNPIKDTTGDIHSPQQAGLGANQGAHPLPLLLNVREPAAGHPHFIII